MVKPTNALLTAAMGIIVSAAVFPANVSAQPECEPADAQSVIESRDNARQRKAEDLQDAIEETTGSVEPDIISDNCVADAFEEGFGAAISMPSVGDVIGAIGDRAYDAFCGAVDDTVRAVDDRVEDATDPVDDLPGVESDAGVGAGNPNDGTGVDGGYNDVTDDIADGVDDAVIDDVEDEVLDGLY